MQCTVVSLTLYTCTCTCISLSFFLSFSLSLSYLFNSSCSSKKEVPLRVRDESSLSYYIKTQHQGKDNLVLFKQTPEGDREREKNIQFNRYSRHYLATLVYMELVVHLKIRGWLTVLDTQNKQLKTMIHNLIIIVYMYWTYTHSPPFSLPLTLLKYFNVSH